MGTINRKDRITRRGFLEFSSAALATAGLLGDANAAKAAPVAANSVAFGVFPQVRFSPIPLCPGGSP